MHGAVVVAALLSLASSCTLLPPNATASPSSSTSTETTPTPSTSPSPSESPTATAQLLATSPPFHGGEVGLAYSAVSLNVVGGLAPYTWSVSSGALPGGLALSSGGQVAGTPSKAGHFTFIATVADSGGGKDSLTGSITIVAALTANFLKACGSTGKCSVEQGCDSTCGGFGYQGGGAGPYSYSLASGSMPPGTGLYGLALAGTFTTTGTYNFKATVTDGYGVAASVSPTFTIFPHISIGGGTITCPYNGCPSPASFPYTGGSGTTVVQVTKWTFTCDSSPTCGTRPSPTAILSASSVSITVAGSIGGNGYHGSFKLTLRDGNLCGSGAYCSVSVTVDVVVQAG